MGIVPEVMRNFIKKFPPETLKPGDVIITNHAATMGQHLNNVAMYSPVFAGDDGAELIGFVVVTAHWLDIGGRVVSSISKYATDIFQ